jgi:hypothetical protein
MIAACRQEAEVAAPDARLPTLYVTFVGSPKPAAVNHGLAEGSIVMLP